MTPPTEAIEIIRSLIDRVIFRPAVNARLEVELIGDIAMMVRFAQKPTENGAISGVVQDAFHRSVKVVAGARSHLYRTRTEWRPSFRANATAADALG
jgi:hypothetical protein